MAFVLSYTAYSDLVNCPRKFFHKHVVRDYPFEESEALVWGRAVHDAFKARLQPPYVPFPPNMVNFELVASIILRAPNLIVEKGLSVMRDGTPVDWNCRVALMKSKGDAITFNHDFTTALLIDHKTGKVREDPTELKFQAAALRRHYPNLRRVMATYNWTQLGMFGNIYDLTNDYHATMPVIIQTATDIEQKLQAEDKRAQFPATPNPLCKYCSAPECKYAEG